jgi:NADPH-dependent stearoyl-CoA 9-desaturase
MDDSTVASGATALAAPLPTVSSHVPSAHPSFASDEARLQSFGAAIDRIRDRIEARVGEEDLRYVRRVDAFSHAMQVAGRTILHFSFEPIGFTVGVLALWIHKQLQATEVGHTALHGAFDRLPGAERYRSKTFRWQVPIDEESWRSGHNVRHHQYTNVAGKDPDIHFGAVRLTEHTPHRLVHHLQLPLALLTVFPVFAFVMNLHFTGLADYYSGGNGRGGDDVLPDRSRKTILAAHKKALRKYVPYYAKEFVFFPLLALLTGGGALKVLLGNWLSELLRDLYSAPT